MSEKSFPVDLVTPDAQLFGGLADFAAIPAWDGEMGFAYLRAPVMVKLGAGEMRIHLEKDTNIQHFAVQGGFAGTDGSHLVVLASRAARLEAFDAQVLRSQLTDLEQRLAEQGLDENERPFLKDELKWLRLVERLVTRRQM